MKEMNDNIKCDGHSHCSCEENGESEEKGKLLRLLIAAVLFCVGLALKFAGYEGIPATVIFAVSYLIAGCYVLYGAVSGIIHGEWFGEEFLMSIASIGAFAIGEFAEACAVMLLFELGEWLQDMAVEKSRSGIREMLELRPEKVSVEKNGKTVIMRPDEVNIGDTIVVLPGEKISCDGVVTEGCGDVDMSSLTGESVPVSKQVGESVLAGSVSMDTTLKIRVTESYDTSTVAKIIDLLENAKEKKSRAENYISRFSKIYTPIVCGLALLLAVVPPLLGFGTFGQWIYRALCALAVSCPCALVISVPLGLFSGLGAASRVGVLVKGGNYLEALATVNAAAFDKTGTVTGGRFVYVGCENAPDEAELKTAVAACEKYSKHPIAVSAIQEFGAFGENHTVTDAVAIPGMGVRAKVDGREYCCGNERLMAEQGADYIRAKLLGTSVYVSEGDRFLGSITFADAIKSDSKKAISDLAALGISDTVMLTGDKRAIAESTAKDAGIGTCCSELLPADKVARFTEEKEKGKRMLYVGDGINDAPVLALADVGIAMGGIGSGAALEAADVVIMGDSLTKIPEVIRISRKTMSIVRQNIILSLAVKLAIIVLAVFGIANLWAAVFGDVGVCLIAVANSLRVMRINK